MKRIAVVDDDPYIGNMLEEVLEKSGYGVLRAYSGTEAVLLLEKDRPDLVLLDLMLPGLSGEQVLPKLRGIPVIVVSAKGATQDKVRLLLDGAADYITKPFSTDELLTRITVVLRNQEPAAISGELSLDEGARCALVRGVPVRLTPTEYAIFRLLLKNPHQVIPKSTILDRISLETPDCTEGSLKQHVSNLRKKLRDAGGKDYIESVWGIGFKIHES